LISVVLLSLMTPLITRAFSLLSAPH